MFTDSHWKNSCEYVLRVAVSLASCVTPFAEDPYLPLEHAEALSLVVRLTEHCRGLDKKCGSSDAPRGGGGGVAVGAGENEAMLGLPTGLHSSLKYCTKKNGLGKATSEVGVCVCGRVSAAFVFWTISLYWRPPTVRVLQQ